MVDALRRAHRALKPRGFLIDARPDALRIPRIVARGRVREHLRQSEDADLRDRRADEAVTRVRELGLFRYVRSGHVWHENSVGDLAALQQLARDNDRYDRLTARQWQRLRRFARGPLSLRRAIKFEVLERL